MKGRQDSFVQLNLIFSIAGHCHKREDESMISTQTMILWVFVICAIGAWILQRHEKRKRRAFIERERERWTDLK
jgi:predicted Co/Zn/Cd cation transporter (cation efflux family)